jgi:hypothetical protein
MKRLKIAALCGAAALFAIPGAGTAQDLMGIARSVYLEGRAGIPITSGTDSTVTSSVAAANGTSETEFNSGNFFSGAIGVTVMPNVRIDVEIGRTHAHDAEFTGNSGFPGNVLVRNGQTVEVLGDATVWTYLFNAYYDFPEVLPGLRPFLGGGIGASTIAVENLTPSGSRFQVNDRDTVMTGAIHLGVGYQIAKQFWLTGRYTAAFSGGPDFRGTDTLNLGGTMTVSSDSQVTHIFGFGLRFAFN